ncbi:hypothetical protein DESA109040_08700 [Deinococcus saxicola]|uniref:hypothetical protein n=1 Tax=Deinococcus saxicola TaxID=249406 RepID=UPI0039EFBA2E
MSHPTVTVPIRQALKYAQGRAEQFGRTQQLEIGADLFIRIAPGGRKFLLFCLDDEPERGVAESIASTLALKNPAYGWHQGQTLRSMTVIEEGAENVPESGPGQAEDGV